MAALTDTLTDREEVGCSIERRVELAADTAEDLMMDWLEEVLYLFEMDALLVHHAEVRVVPAGAGDTALRLSAVLHGEPRDPDRHPHKVLVKAVTWHALHVTPGEDGWTGRVIFDI